MALGARLQVKIWKLDYSWNITEYDVKPQPTNQPAGGFLECGIGFRVLFWIFLQTCYSKLSGLVNLQKKGTARFWMSNSPIKALTLWMLATFGIRSSSKIKSLRTFNTRSRHAFPIAIPVLLLPRYSTTKQVCSNSTFRVFPRIPHLATALIHHFCMLHVAI